MSVVSILRSNDNKISVPEHVTSADKKANGSDVSKTDKHETHPRIQKLIDDVEPIRKVLVNHPVYAMVNSVDRLNYFMRAHIYAVWDFMSLLKYLQRELTCIDLPWVAVGDPTARYLINEIVTDEESDTSEEGVRMSHFELYLLSMEKAGASTDEINHFIKNIIEGRKTLSPNSTGTELTVSAMQSVGTEKFVQDFVKSTFSVIDSGKLHVAASVFTFGREDLIPQMFISFVSKLHEAEPDKFSIFKYYLERHIEVDGDHHAILAHEMTALLCGDDDKKWEEATAAVKAGLEARVQLWDGIQKYFESY